MSIFTGWFHESMKFRILKDGLELEVNPVENQLMLQSQDEPRKQRRWLSYVRLALYMLVVFIQH